MNSSASSHLSAAALASQHESITALVLWRLCDPSWRPSFSGLLEDARTCIDPGIGRAGLLEALRAALVADASVAALARKLAVEAGQLTPRSMPATIGKRLSGTLLERWSRTAAVPAAGQNLSGTATSKIRN